LAAPGKEGGHASVVEAGVLEVAEHGIRAGMGHGVMVLGLAPGAVLLAVAACTTVTADKPGGHRRCRSCRRRYLGCGRSSRRRHPSGPGGSASISGAWAQEPPAAPGAGG